MQIRYAEAADIDKLAENDEHITKEELKNAVRLHRVYIAEEDGRFAGWLRYNLFWDNTPFMNLLYMLEPYRGKGFGKEIVSFWEEEMAQQGYETVMTSTSSVEYAQHFYFKLGYAAIGGFRLDGDFYEVIFAKQLGESSPCGFDI